MCANPHHQMLQAAANTERQEQIENSGASSLCKALRRWGPAAVKYVGAAGGACNRNLKQTLHSTPSNPGPAPPYV